MKTPVLIFPESVWRDRESMRGLFGYPNPFTENEINLAVKCDAWLGMAGGCLCGISKKSESIGMLPDGVSEKAIPMGGKDKATVKESLTVQKIATDII